MYTEYTGCCFQLSGMPVSGRLHILIVNQLVQTLLPEESLVENAHVAVMILFSQNQIPKLNTISQPFIERCVVLFTTVNKASLLKSILLDFFSVLMNSMSEVSFISKYSQVFFVCCIYI